jgi:C4-dicarboxylate-specific signal transduction histidine kinase
MAFPRLLSQPAGVLALGYLIGYVLLDWVSFVHPFGAFGITPWNPPTGLSLALVLIFGRTRLPLLFIAPLLADFLVRRHATPWGVALATTAVIGTGYSLASLALLSPQLRFTVALSTMRNLALLLLVAGTAAALVAIGCVAIFALSGLVETGDFLEAALRYWVGDVIGIAVTTPFLLILLTRRRTLRLHWETALQAAAIVAGLVLVFTLGRSRELQLFYILFLPIVWIAVRTGLEGVTFGLVLTQLGLIVAVQMSTPSSADATAFQALMLVLTLTGLAAGVLVTERQRAELQLRLQQEAQAHLSRLGSMGELASGLAHEINQPLMAAGTYTRLVAEGIRTGSSSDKVGEAAAKAVVQVERASEVVRRLRELIHLGRSEIMPVAVARVVDECIELLRPEIERDDIRIERRIPASLPPVMADLLQAEQVVINLVRNAVEAIRDSGREHGLVTIEASRRDRGFVQIEVRDNGPGFGNFLLGEPPQPLQSTKAYGMGVGLSLSRSLVEAQGGELTLANAEEGAVARFTLPVAGTEP